MISLKNFLTVFIVIITIGVNISVLVNVLKDSPLFKNKGEAALILSLKELKQTLSSLKTRHPLVIKELKEKEATATAKLKMEILNGSGLPGKAKETEEKIKIENLDITIANTEATPATTLKLKKTVPQFLKERILNTLLPEFPTISSEELPEDHPLDLILIIGIK